MSTTLCEPRGFADPSHSSLRQKELADASFEDGLKLSTRVLRKIGVKKKKPPKASDFQNPASYVELFGLFLAVC